MFVGMDTISIRQHNHVNYVVLKDALTAHLIQPVKIVLIKVPLAITIAMVFVQIAILEVVQQNIILNVEDASKTVIYVMLPGIVTSAYLDISTMVLYVKDVAKIAKSAKVQKYVRFVTQDSSIIFS